MKQRYSPRPLAAATLALCLSGAATLPAQTIDLAQLGTTHPGFVINGVNSYDSSGYSVSGAGDVNGDGLADLIVGSPTLGLYGTEIGESYVVFGKKDGSPVELNSLGTAGFTILGIGLYTSTARSVSGAGDVNGDGLADLIVGALGANSNGNRSGESFVVFGKQDSALVDPNNLGTGGFRIIGASPFDYSGSSVSGAGDVNGDGMADIIIGASRANANGYNFAGESYVVFGKSDVTTVDLGNLGAGGFRIDGIDAFDFAGTSVSGAGDVNGDGLADLIVGAIGADPNGDTYAGESYVVFGKPDGTTVDLGNLATNGFRINGSNPDDFSGRSVSGAGDVNGDGLADLIVGASYANSGAGESYVVFGKSNTSTVELNNLGTEGFIINGIDTNDYSGRSVSGAGDLNGDGLADIIVGAFRADPNGIVDAGETYVVFGKANSTAVDLGNLGTEGFRIDGIDMDDRSGRSVSGAGDVNGDGLADLIVGGLNGDPNGFSNAGESYVIFSPATPPASATYLAKAKAGDAPRVAVGITGDGSNDSTPDARAFIDFADGATTSTQTVTLIRSNTSIQNLPNAADVMWEISTDRLTWTTAELTLRYTDDEIAGLEESELQLLTALSPSGPWEVLPTQSLDLSRNQITGTVNFLSYYALSAPPNRVRVEQADGTFIQVESPTGTVIEKVDLLTPTLTIPPNTTFPEGLLDIQISGGPVGGTIPVTITYENRIAGPAYNDFYISDGLGSYEPISPAANVNDNGTTVTVTLQLAD